MTYEEARDKVAMAIVAGYSPRGPLGEIEFETVTADRILAALGLAPGGSNWLAPREASDQIIDVLLGAGVDWRTADVYAAMRDAHMKELEKAAAIQGVTSLRSPSSRSGPTA